MHVKSQCLDFSPELIPYDCFIHPNFIRPPRMTWDKTRAKECPAVCSTVDTPLCPTYLVIFSTEECSWMQRKVICIWCSHRSLEALTKTSLLLHVLNILFSGELGHLVLIHSYLTRGEWGRNTRLICIKFEFMDLVASFPRNGERVWTADGQRPLKMSERVRDGSSRPTTKPSEPLLVSLASRV